MTGAELLFRERLMRIWAQAQREEISDEEATRATEEATEELRRMRAESSQGSEAPR